MISLTLIIVEYKPNLNVNRNFKVYILREQDWYVLKFDIYC